MFANCELTPEIWPSYHTLANTCGGNTFVVHIFLENMLRELVSYHKDFWNLKKSGKSAKAQIPIWCRKWLRRRLFIES